MRRSIENKIRFNAVLIYIAAAAICGIIIFYAIIMGRGMASQRKDIELYYKQLVSAENLIRTVNQAQGEANLYVSTKQDAHLVRFRNAIVDVEAHLDSVRMAFPDHSQDSILSQISVLLNEKERNVLELNRQFNSSNPIEPISERLRTFEPVQPRDSIVVDSLTVFDTVIDPGRRGFFRRLFSPKKIEADTIVSTTTKVVVDTLKLTRDGASEIVAEMSGAAERASRDYLQRMNSIERNVSRLIIADQDVSARISDLMLNLYSRIVYSNHEKLEEREKLISRINSGSVLTGFVALVLILVFIVLIINDVNKGRAAREALEKANLRTRQLMEERHKLLLSVSHDIKTPLGSILGYLELSDGKGLAAGDIASMQASGRHILSLLENLLEFSSLEQGTVQLSRRDFRLLDLCDDVAGLMAPLAAKKSLRFDTGFEFDKELWLCSDPMRIKQIVINVLSNAVKYTSEGTVGLTVAYNDGALCFMVTDTGVGIPKDKISGIYRPFSRVEQNNSVASGSGFGMYVVKGLVDLLSGGIEVHSEVGEGTEVSVSIPAAAAEPPVTEKAQVGSILLVDDDTALLKMMRDMCVRLGVECEICDSEACFDGMLGDIGRYGMVVTDMEMGSLTGFDILGRIREHGSRVPVTLMTGRGEYTAADAAKAGFDGYMPKPVTLKALAALLNIDIETESGASSLEQMLGGDMDAVREVLTAFLTSTAEHLELLEKAAGAHDFAAAQAVCHKMLPMFMQTGADATITDTLKKMDSMRGIAEGYAGWEDEVGRLIPDVRNFSEKLRADYDISLQDAPATSSANANTLIRHEI